jgi:hypothetical protein
MPEEMGKFFQLGEIIWTYFLPLSLITILDIKVRLNSKYKQRLPMIPFASR